MTQISPSVLLKNDVTSFATPAAALAAVAAATNAQPKSARTVLRQVVLARRAQTAIKNNALLIEATANALHDLGFYAQAAKQFKHIAEAYPASSRALYNVGRSLLSAQQLSTANDWFARSELLEPDYPMTLLGKGFIQLITQNYAQGWPLYEQRLRADGFVPRKVNNVSLWAGQAEQPIAGKTIFVANEQGLGDTLMFFRYVIALAALGAKVIVLVQPRLQPWIAHAVAQMGEIGTLGGKIVSVVAEGDPVQKTDYWCPMPSLPAKLEAWKTPPPALLTVPHAALPQAKTGVLKVGLAWSGEALNNRNAQRSFEFKHIAVLLGTPNVQFFNLQMGEPLAHAQKHPLWKNVIDLVPLQTSFYETAQHIVALDLVITVDTSILHATGALGKPFWALLDSGAEWRNGLAHQTVHPFYPQGRLYRASRRGFKSQIVAKLQRDLILAAQKFMQSQTPNQIQTQTQTRTADKQLAPVLQGQWLSMTHAKHGVFAFNRHDVFVGRSLALYGEVLDAELALCSALLPSNGTVVEVGAGIGAQTVALAKHLNQGGSVLAFEAQRTQFALLNANLTLNEINNARAHLAVVGAKAGRCSVPQFAPTLARNCGAINLKAQANLSASQTESVTMLALDDLAMQSFNLLKLDVQGMEWDVLMGTTKHIANFKPFIYMCNPARPAVENREFPDWLNLLQTLGYVVYAQRVSLFSATNFASNSKNVFTDKVSTNFLAVPASTQLNENLITRCQLLRVKPN